MLAGRGGWVKGEENASIETVGVVMLAVRSTSIQDKRNTLKPSCGKIELDRTNREDHSC